mgnify:FL=1
MTAGITKEGKHKTWKMNGKPIGENQVNNIDACKRNESCINTVIRTMCTKTLYINCVKYWNIRK